MAKFSKAGNWYVDSYYGNDTTGSGTKENPFKTMLRAHAVASGGQRVICRGFFSDIIPNSKSLHWESEGLSVIDGTAASDDAILLSPNSMATITGFRINNFNGSKLAASCAGAFQECEFNYCRLSSYRYASNMWQFFRCVFNDVGFVKDGASTGFGSITFCTFANCSGSLGWSTNYASFVIRNSIFANSNLELILNTERPAASEFNYCSITGLLGGKTIAQWQAYGNGYALGNGYQVASTADIFNDYSAGRDALTFWQQDFTMKPASILRDAASDGLEIGAKRVGYRFSADALWNIYRESSTNLSYSVARGLMLLDLAQGQGNYESTWISLGASIEFDMANLYAAFVLAGGTAQQFLGSRPLAPDSTKNQRKAFDFQLAIADSDNGLPDWKSQEFYRRVRLDAEGRGVGDDSYNPTSIQIPKGAYFKIAFQMNNLAITA